MMQLLLCSWQRVAVLAIALCGSLYSFDYLFIPSLPTIQQWAQSQVLSQAPSLTTVNIYPPRSDSPLPEEELVRVQENEPVLQEQRNVSSKQELARKNGLSNKDVMSQVLQVDPNGSATRVLPTGTNFEFRNASWLPGVWTRLSQCGASASVNITEHFARESCAKNCTGLGVCNHKLAECRCFHGFTGVACELEQQFECNRAHGKGKEEEYWQFGEWISSMCSATCDKSKSFCYCGEGTKYPKRPVAEQCGFSKIADTDWRFDWNKTDLHIFSNSSNVNGWCNLDPVEQHGARVQRRKKDCFCTYEGSWGDLCEIPVESTCYNQCSGNGVCRGGFCACGAGWYGIDCSIPSDIATVKRWPRWLAHAIVHNNEDSLKFATQQQTEVTMKRSRPLIYVYDLPPKYNSLLMEGRHFKFHCVNRVYDVGNSTRWTNQLYGSENAMLESLLASEHRTTNAEEADFFYVPVLGACATARADEAPHMDTEKDYLGLRSYFSSDLYKQAYQHIKDKYPYWDRSDGRDHIWLFPWDEGACSAPKEIWGSMMLVHWGNTNTKHSHSTTGYPSDKWDDIPTSWRGTHPCYDPEKDLVLPAWKYPDPYPLRMKLWARSREKRPTLFYFRGNLGSAYGGGRPEAKYSMRIRQRLAEEFGTEPNREGLLGRQVASDVKVFNARTGNYSIELSVSRFCGVFPGDGWSGRMEDSILHGCIPVIIQDGVQLPFENVLDYSQFAVRITEDNLPEMVTILRSIPDSQVDSMQARIQRLWQRFTYHNAVQLEADRQKLQGHVPDWATEFKLLSGDDAFTTFIQVLSYKIGQQQWRSTSKHNGDASNVDCRDYSYEQ